jgi:DNA-binding MarR family transcriptional regulator
MDMADNSEERKDAIWLHCSNSAVRRASRQLNQLYEDAMGDTGIKGTQFSLLSQIGYSNEPSLKVLAETIVMDLSALGHTLKPLIRDGLVELFPDEKDKRVKRVRLTEAGAVLQRDLTARWRIAQDRFDAAFGKERSEELRRTLAFVSSNEFAQAFKGSK